MATNWKTVTGADLWKVLSSVVQRKSNENEPDSDGKPTGLDETNNLDMAEANRRDEIVTICVNEIRATIGATGRIPLSATEGTIPPEAVRHCLNMAAYQLCNSTPSLQMYLITEKGAVSPFAVWYKEAIDFLKKISAGGTVTYPSDPAADFVSPVLGGDIVGSVDLATPGVVGGADYTGYDDPNGVQVGQIGDVYYQIAGGVITKTWLKVSGNGTNTGWK